jgi:hypothetical protein
MRRPAFLLSVLAFAVASDAFAGAARTLEFTRVGDGIATVVINAGKGGIELRADSSTTITARVEVTAKGSGKSDQEQLAALTLKAELQGDTLRLRVAPPDGDSHNIGESWAVRVPARLAVKLNLGVGDVSVLDSAGAVRVNVGVGDVKIEGLDASFGDISAAAGVGSATLTAPGGRREGTGFIGHALSAKGSGTASLHANAGVGDIVIRLR